MALTLTPWACDTSDPVHQAEIVRRAFGAVVGAAGGVASETALRVTPKAGTPNMSVDVAAGFGFVPANAINGGVFGVHNDGVINVPITDADPGNPRITLIVLVVDNTSTFEASIIAIDGDAAAIPEPPEITADNFQLLATIEVPLNASSITGGITDERPLVGESSVAARLAALPQGFVREETSSVASSAMTSVGMIRGVSGTAITISNTSDASRRYRVDVECRFSMGSGGSNGLYRPAVISSGAAIHTSPVQVLATVVGGPGQVGAATSSVVTVAAGSSMVVQAGGSRVSGGTSSDVITAGRTLVTDIGRA